jgi:hypothetical protein
MVRLIKPPNRAAFFCARWAAQVSRHILFQCPRLGTNVQHWLSATAPEDGPNAYRSVVCLACTRLHFIPVIPALSSLLYFSCGTDFAAVRNRIGSEG